MVRWGLAKGERGFKTDYIRFRRNVRRERIQGRGGVKSVTCVYRGSGWDNGEGRENDANEAGREREVLRGKEVVV